MELKDILEGKEPEPQATEEVNEETKPEEVEAAQETEPEAEVVDSEPEGEVAEPPSAESKEVPIAALLDERDKRKSYETRVKELESQIEESKKETKDFWESPEEAINERIRSAVEPLEQNFRNAYMGLSMQYSAQIHSDFNDARDAFLQAAESNPALAEQVFTQEMPGEFIYNVGKQFMELNAVGGDVNKLRDQIRHEERERILKEMKEKEGQLQKVPQPLTDHASASAPREKVEGGPTPLSNIFPNQR